MKAWLGLGSNLQQPLKRVREALDRLGQVEEIEVVKVSSFYLTPPWGDEKQGDFINAVVQVETSLNPIPLLHVLQSIEDEMGRQRNERRWGPRLIDLDLLLFGDQPYHSDELVLPHPRLFERAFVLIPLCELAASLEIPGHGVIEKLLEKVDCSGIFRLNDEGLD